MTANAARTGAGVVQDRKGLPRWVTRLGLHAFVIGLMVIWLIPTIGLLVNSFRTPEASNSSGWWTALFPPKELTFEN